MPDEYGLAIRYDDFYTWTYFLHMAHVEWINDSYTEVKLDSPRAIEVLKFLRDLANTYGVATNDTGSFMNGNAGLSLDGTWMMHSLKTQVSDLTWDIIPIPKYAESLSPMYYMGGNTGSDAMITTQCKHPEEAWKFVQFTLGPYVQLDKAKTKLEIPFHLDALTSDVYMTPPPEHIEVIVDIMTDPHSVFEPSFIGFGEVYNAILNALTPAMKGEEAIGNAVIKAQHDANVALERVLRNK